MPINPSDTASNLTPERLRELLAYDADAGMFFWRVKPRNIKIGAPAGGLMSTGYITIKIDGRGYLAHRLAWLYSYGRWPDQYIDHVNGLRADNRLVNLRDVTHAENSRNWNRPRRDNKSGCLGAARSGRQENPWKAVIHINGKQYRLGVFKTAEDAHVAYVAARRQLHEFGTL